MAYLKASNPNTFHHFGEGDAISFHTGNAVAVSADGTTIAVGAQHERSTSRGVNGAQNIDSAYDAGAVYVFTRRGTKWTQQAYLKASNAESGDLFGDALRSVTTATRSSSAPPARTATPPASTATRPTTAPRRPGPRTSSRAAARPGASRPTSKPPTPAMRRRRLSRRRYHSVPRGRQRRW